MDYVAFYLINYTQNKMQSKTTTFIEIKSPMTTRLGRSTKHFVKQVLLFDVVLGLEHS
jgi:hypothetical protein